MQSIKYDGLVVTLIEKGSKGNSPIVRLLELSDEQTAKVNFMFLLKWFGNKIEEEFLEELKRRKSSE